MTGRMRAAIIALALCTAAPLAAQRVKQQPANAEMTAIFEADQADRRGVGAAIDWSAVTPRDEARRARTLALLDAGALRTGDDFWHAAFVFQHGSAPNDYLLAHTLAVIAAAR